jgi:hypothetical protein
MKHQLERTIHTWIVNLIVVLSAHEVLDAGASCFFHEHFSVGNNLGAISPEGLLLGIAFGPPLSKGSAF